ncbi:MAG: dTDP-4-dehydrorhamnose reductase [Psychroflexus halocasei]
MKVLVTGANGQLGQVFQKKVKQIKADFNFQNSSSLDLTNHAAVESFFQENEFDYCINCAAYTNVEAAETEIEKAFLVNARAAENLAKVCHKNQVVLIHPSTDYVFDGEKETAYLEVDETQPINVYGASKLKGEELIQKSLKEHFIIRTSWLYSEFGKNFFTFIKSQIDQNAEEVKITTEQKGTPTNANDLADFILWLISDKSKAYGVYHFSNLGSLTWYDFTLEIKSLYESKMQVSAVDYFKTKAKRPQNSTLDKSKLIKNFNYQIKSWDKSLANLITEIG